MNLRARVLLVLLLALIAGSALRYVNLYGLAYDSVRPAAMAGFFYPADPDTLRSTVDGLLDARPAADCGAPPRALVVPHAGYEWSGPLAAAAAATVRGCPIRRVWVLGPSHELPLQGLGVYAVDAFATPLGEVAVDVEASVRLATHPRVEVVDNDLGEHAIEGVLPWFQRALGGFELVPVLVGGLDEPMARELAEALREAIGPGDLVVISSDFLHQGDDFGYHPDVPEGGDLMETVHAIDRGAWDRLAAVDPEGLLAHLEATRASICGRRALVLLSLLLDPSARGTRLAYATSADVDGRTDRSVSYLAGRFDGPDWTGRPVTVGGARLLPADEAEALRSWAEAVARATVLGEPEPPAPPVDARLGVFVTLRREGSLRGCVGHIDPSEVIEAIRSAARQATHDPRLPPVTADELPTLETELTLLSPPQRLDDPALVIPGRHGVVLSLGPARATLLPQVAPEEGWDRSQLLDALVHKAGIPPASVPLAQLEVYEAQIVDDRS